MGNQSANSIRADISSRRITSLLAMNDCYVGNYVILQDRARPDALFMQTELNPENYDQFTVDYEEFQRRIETSHEGICNFMSIDPSERNPEVYEMVFEFGHFVLVLETAKSIWEFIHQAVAALSFLEASGLHFPFVRKKYFVYLQTLRRFKVVNPFCFPSFLADYMRVYSDAGLSLPEKTHFQRGKLNVNVRELGFVVLSLIFNVDEASLIQTPALIRPKLREVRTRFGDDLFAFVSFLIECRAQLTFRDVQAFLKTGGHPLFPNPLLRPTLEAKERSSDFKMNAPGANGLRIAQSLPVPESRSSAEQLKHAPDTRAVHLSLEPPLRTPSSLRQVEPAPAPLHPLQDPPTDREKTVSRASEEHAPPQLVKSESGSSEVSQGAKKGLKVVKKRIKWVTEKQCHMEVLEFEDGSTEERVPQNQEMLKQIMKNYQTKMTDNPAQAPHAPKPSAMHLYNPETLASKAVDQGLAAQSAVAFSIVLFLQDSAHSGKVIFKNNVPDTYDSFTEMRAKVDMTHPLRPSLYHDESVDVLAEASGKASLEGPPAREDSDARYKVKTIEAHPFSAHSN